MYYQSVKRFVFFFAFFANFYCFFNFIIYSNNELSVTFLSELKVMQNET